MKLVFAPVAVAVAVAVAAVALGRAAEAEGSVCIRIPSGFVANGASTLLCVCDMGAEAIDAAEGAALPAAAATAAVPAAAATAVVAVGRVPAWATAALHVAGTRFHAGPVCFCSTRQYCALL